VTTAMTPGILLAAATSMVRIVACATGLRMKAAWACPGRSISSVNCPAPLTSAASSLRIAWWPLPNRRPASGGAERDVFVALRCTLMIGLDLTSASLYG
jgi:hypothetical protein